MQFVNTKSSSEKINVVQYGLGPIGIGSLKESLSKKRIRVIGAVDIDPNKIGKDIGDFVNAENKLGVSVVGSINDIARNGEKFVAVHTTSSFMDKTFDEFVKIMKCGGNIVSSTEELLLPQLRSMEKAEQLDAVAKQNGVSIVGTGINPGFAMDTLAVALTGVCNSVEHIYAERVVDAATRREPLQRKVGAGMSVEEFRELADAGKLGHIGLKESIAFVAQGLGWDLDDIEETIDPMVADKDYTTAFLTVNKGEAAGIKNIGAGYNNGKELIKLDLRMYVGAENPHDSIKVTGTPPVNMTVTNGFAGDIATVASLVNNIPKVLDASPGLYTMMDLPVPRVFS